MSHTTYSSEQPARRGLTRRRALVGAGATAALGWASTAGGLGASSWLRRQADADPDSDVETGSFASKFRGGRQTGWVVVRPKGATAALRPVVHLHGLGGDHNEVLGLGVAQKLAAVVAPSSSSTPVPPFAVVGVDGGKTGEGTYFHPRATGEDAGRMVIEELLPLLAQHGLDTSRIGLHGLSMGGFGALRIGALLGPPQVAAICAASPALWLPGTGTAPGAFDSTLDHQRYSGFELRDVLSKIPLRIDIGESDPFASATRSFISGLNPKPEGGFYPGGHDGTFWEAHLQDELEWLGRHLANG